MKKDYFKVEVTNQWDDVELSETYHYFSAAYEEYNFEIKERIGNGGVKVTLYSLNDDGSQKELMHCQF